MGQKWSKETLLERFGDVPFECGPCELPLKVFYAYAQANIDDVPLFVLTVPSQPVRLRCWKTSKFQLCSVAATSLTCWARRDPTTDGCLWAVVAAVPNGTMTLTRRALGTPSCAEGNVGFCSRQVAHHQVCIH